MSDRYLGFANSNLGRRLVDALGLPVRRRWSDGRQGACVPWRVPWCSEVAPGSRWRPSLHA